MLQIEQDVHKLKILVNGDPEYNSPGILPMVTELHKQSLHRNAQMRGALVVLMLLLLIEGVVNWETLLGFLAF